VKKVSAKEHEEALNLFVRESSEEESDSSNEKDGAKRALEGHVHSDGEDDDVWEEVDLSHRKEFSFDDLNGEEEAQDLEVTLDRTQQSMRLK
jgi:hypothetical protein